MWLTLFNLKGLIVARRHSMTGLEVLGLLISSRPSIAPISAHRRWIRHLRARAADD
jgi:hypothetical protein